MNGVNTQGENIADNGGIWVAYLAYRQKLDSINGSDPQLPGLNYTPRQMFWIAAAHSECAKYLPENLKSRITVASHSPAEFRVRGPLSNIKEFSEDFNCKIGSQMNPENKCDIWS